MAWLAVRPIVPGHLVYHKLRDIISMRVGRLDVMHVPYEPRSRKTSVSRCFSSDFSPSKESDNKSLRVTLGDQTG